MESDPRRRICDRFGSAMVLAELILSLSGNDFFGNGFGNLFRIAFGSVRLAR
jgi:hypothetical protein